MERVAVLRRWIQHVLRPEGGWMETLLLARFSPSLREPPSPRSVFGSGAILHARVSSEPNDPDKPKRQSTYLEALATLPHLHIHEGYHAIKEIRCPRCGAIFQSREEKMTDVNIAVEILGDAQDDVFDTAILISADSDLTHPVEAVLQRYPEKRVVVALPPRRSSVRLRSAATASFTIGRGKLSSSQLPERVTKADGHVLTRPHQWR